jgi:hypothetical protein
MGIDRCDTMGSSCEERCDEESTFEGVRLITDPLPRGQEQCKRCQYCDIAIPPFTRDNRPKE